MVSNSSLQLFNSQNISNNDSGEMLRHSMHYIWSIRPRWLVSLEHNIDMEIPVLVNATTKGFA